MPDSGEHSLVARALEVVELRPARYTAARQIRQPSPLGIVALMSFNVITPTLGVAFGFGAALPVVDLLAMARRGRNVRQRMACHWPAWMTVAGTLRSPPRSQRNAVQK